MATKGDDQERRQQRGQPLLEPDETRRRRRRIREEHHPNRETIGRLHRIPRLVRQIPPPISLGRLYVLAIGRGSQRPQFTTAQTEGGEFLGGGTQGEIPRVLGPGAGFS